MGGNALGVAGPAVGTYPIERTLCSTAVISLSPSTFFDPARKADA